MKPRLKGKNAGLVLKKPDPGGSAALPEAIVRPARSGALDRIKWMAVNPVIDG